MKKLAKQISEILKELKVAIYIRVSTQYQIDRASLPVQREELINYAKYALGIENYVVFEDAGYSAKNTDRPDYQKMISRIRTGEFTHLLVWKIDRISRNLLDFASMYQELKDLGVTFVSKNEQFDTSSAIGEAMLKIILVFAELERNMTSERVSQVMISRANSGHWNGGRIPFGYEYDKKTREFSIVEEEAKIIRHIHDLYDAKRSLVACAKYLNDRGIKTRSGIDWNPTTVRTMLVNPFYAGVYRYNHRNESNKPSRYKPESEWIWIENHHPAIISMERLNHVTESLKKRNRGGVHTYTRKNTHIFAGLLRCGYCGSTMASTIDRPRADGYRPSVYICTKRRRTDNCQNKYVSDITIGPFILNYIANLIKVSNSFGKSTSIETLEKKLLRGPTFANVDHIGRPGLEELYNHLRSGYDSISFISNTVTLAESSSEISEREVLLSERRRLDRALNRLKSLYLYGDAELPEKDFIIERQKLTDSIIEIDVRLCELDAAIEAGTNLSDEEFIAKASYFILTQQLQDKRHIDFDKLIRKIDPQIIKDFIQSVVQNFCIKDGLTISILFKNGIEHQFFYKASEKDQSPET